MVLTEYKIGTTGAKILIIERRATDPTPVLCEVKVCNGNSGNTKLARYPPDLVERWIYCGTPCQTQRDFADQRQQIAIEAQYVCQF